MSANAEGMQIDLLTPDVVDVSRISLMSRPATEGIRLRIQLFDHLAAFTSAGHNVLPQGRKTQAVLAILAMSSPNSVSRDELAKLLWSQRGRVQARASLRQSVLGLARFLGALHSSLLHAERTALRLNADAILIDIAEVEASSGSRPSGLELYRPKLLGDLAGLDPAFEQWRLDHQERLTALARERASDALASVLCDPEQNSMHNRIGLRSDNIGTLVGAAERLIRIDPAHEGAWLALIRAYVARGDRAAAVAAFDRCRDALAQTARLRPGAEMVELVNNIRGLPQHFLSAASADAPQQQNNPAQVAEGSRTCIGVMPFQHLGSGKQDELSYGLTEEITAALSRVAWLSCVAPTAPANSSLSMVSDKVRHEFALDFALEGTVQRSGGRVRVTTRLLDLHAGREIVWARRFDREDGDTLALQDEITAGVVAQVEPELLMLEGERAQKRARRRQEQEAAGDRRQHSSAISTSESLLQAIPSIYRLEPDAFHAAGDLLATAVSVEPNSAPAHAWFGYWHLFQVGQGWSTNPERDTRVGGELAERAVTLDVGNARALTIAGHICGFLRRQPDEALALHDMALSLNPHCALAWCFSGLALSYLGRHQEAIFRADTARRLAPLDPHAFFFEMAAGMPYLLLGQHERTVECSLRSLALNTAFSSTYKGLLSALGHLERSGDAVRIRKRLLVLEPGFTVADAIRRSPLKVPADLAHYAEGLRKGGLL